MILQRLSEEVWDAVERVPTKRQFPLVTWNGFAKIRPPVNDKLIITPVPALVAVLLAKEKEKGAPLTQAEIEEITDKAVCIAMPQHARQKVDESRGYQDIDPERAWEQWLVVRKDLL